MSYHDMEPNAFLIWQNFIIAKSRCYTGASPSMPRHTALDEVVPAPRFLGASGLGVVRLLLSGSPGLLSPPLNWG
jgi:hypothetical protein